jgi:hypothetical protein
LLIFIRKRKIGYGPYLSDHFADYFLSHVFYHSFIPEELTSKYKVNSKVQAKALHLFYDRHFKDTFRDDFHFFEKLLYKNFNKKDINSYVPEKILEFEEMRSSGLPIYESMSESFFFSQPEKEIIEDEPMFSIYEGQTESYLRISEEKQTFYEVSSIFNKVLFFNLMENLILQLSFLFCNFLGILFILLVFYKITVFLPFFVIVLKNIILSVVFRIIDFVFIYIYIFTYGLKKIKGYLKILYLYQVRLKIFVQKMLGNVLNEVQ